MKIIPHCGACQPDADPGPLMDGATEASCAHCGCVVTRLRRWKTDGAGILIGVDAFECTAPGEQPTVPPAKA